MRKQALRKKWLFLLIPATITSQVASAQWLSFMPEWLQIVVTILGSIFVPVGVIILFVGMWRKVFYTIWYVISLQPLCRSLLRRRLASGLEYYRDAPAGGDFKVANAVMNSISSAYIADYSGLFGALILRLIDKEALCMEWKSTMYGTEPHAVLSINKKATPKGMSDIEQGFFSLMEGATT